MFDAAAATVVTACIQIMEPANIPLHLASVDADLLKLVDTPSSALAPLASRKAVERVFAPQALSFAALLQLGRT